MTRIQAIGLLAALLCAPVPSVAQSTPQAIDIAKAVDRKYQSLRSLRMDFTEIYSGAGPARTESGTLWLKRTGKMRWEYKTPREKLFLSDGKNAYFYVPGERQARKASLKNVDDLRSPLRFLLGKAKLTKELDQLAVVQGLQAQTAGNTIISGVPKRLADRVSRVFFEVSPRSQILRISIEETDGTTTEFRFSEIAEDVPVADSSFKFQAPAGTELIETKDVTGH